VLQFGDEQAQQLGLPVTRVRRVVIIAAALTTAAAVAFAGVIGFVGLVVPHILRLFIGGDYRRLLALSLPAGAAFLLVADVLARIVLAPRNCRWHYHRVAAPPFFLWLLRAARVSAPGVDHVNRLSPDIHYENRRCDDLSFCCSRARFWPLSVRTGRESQHWCAA
jgi:iron complex transport system permease protein